MKRVCAALLSVAMLISITISNVGSVYATQLQEIQAEWEETQPIEECESTQPANETVPLVTEVVATEPCETVTPTTLPKETIGQALTEPQKKTEQSEPPLTMVPGSLEQDPAQLDTMMFHDPLGAEVILETGQVHDAESRDDDLASVSGQGISFRLFNYSTSINKASDNAAWRSISSYFTFRNSKLESGTDAATVYIPSPNTNSEHDQDGFTKHHATVERVLDGGYPVLDLTRNADGSTRTDPQIDKATRSLRYLFSSGDHAVTAYSPRNTILQHSGSHYWYDSAAHAVDYDISSDLFRLRSYSEKNSTTAGYGAAYGDFLPFTYTGGEIKDFTEEGIPYHVDTADTDYWFGMTMQVNFFQTKDGRLGDEPMVFRFSGDDDVWVFVDDVLVLDLGGTHGTVNGSINFATGEVLQYLNWGGANGTETERTGGSDTSFPTSLRACFDAAGSEPNGGWSTDGQTFAPFTEHILKFFYLERGAAVANCSLDFRLPTLPDESLTVTKDLMPAENTQIRDYIADTMDYSFRVMKVDETGKATNEPYITSGMTYDRLENGAKVGTGTVGEDNCFRLKAGESAQFTQMLRKGNGATQYIVEEIMPEGLTGQYEGVSYLVSGVGGETVTENDPAKAFTAFQTGILSAEQTQTVIFQNRVDSAKLGTLKIAKQAAPGTQIPQDLHFQIQIKLGGDLLPVGTVYLVEQEQRVVETAGIILLRADETAIIEAGILAGTEYRITELSAAVDGYRPSYTAVTDPLTEVNCTPDGISGIFPLAGTVHATIVNADYDFAVQIPVHKKVLDFQKESAFRFLVEKVENREGHWETVETLPDCEITVSGVQTAEKVITIGYRLDEEGTYYYRITEYNTEENYLYDTSIYFVEVTVFGGIAEITDITKNDISVDSVSFVNRAVTELTVTKTITGGFGSMEFPFTAEVYLDGEAFRLSKPAEDLGYTVNENVAHFSLGHDERITLHGIPINARVIVTEHDHDGFLVFNCLENTDEVQISGASREVHCANTAQTVHFTNQSGFRLPNTGGIGTAFFTIGGGGLSLSMAASAVYERANRIRRKNNSPDA